MLRVRARTERNITKVRSRERARLQRMYVRGVSLDCYDFTRIHLDSNKHGVVLDEVPLLHHLMGDEAREAETERIWLAARSLEVFPSRIRYEALHDVASLLRDDRLIEHGERHAMRERPSQQRIVFAGQDLDIYRNVTALASAVSIQEDGGL